MVVQETVRFLLAARNGDLSTLQSGKVSESLQDDHGATCLHYAARGGSVEVLKYLVSSLGFRPTRRSNVGATACHDAAATGNLEALRWLLEQSEVKVDDQDGTGATVTHLSARYGHTQTLEWLLDETNCDVLKKSASGAVALHFAAEGGHLECVKILIAEAPRSVNMQMNNGSTPAYLACQRGYVMTAEYLVAKNSSPKIHTFDGMSPLHAAAQMGHLHIVRWLIKDQGLNPNERDFDGATPLHYAASRGHEDCLDWLLREGGARIVLDNLGGSPLHSAAEFGNSRIVKALLSNGCDREITDNEGLTAQELAEKCGHDNTAAVLRGEVVNAEKPTTLAAPAPAKVRPPSPKNPPPPRRRSTTSTRFASGESSSAAFPERSESKKTPAPPPPGSKPPTPLPLRAESIRSSVEQADASVPVVFHENSPRNAALGDGVFDRSMSLASVASSASSFGYFSPHGGGKIEVVEVDVHDAPSRVCIFNSQETGEREVAPCPLTDRSTSSPKVSKEDFAKAASSAKFYITSSTSDLPPIKSSYLPPDVQAKVSKASVQEDSPKVSVVRLSSSSPNSVSQSQEGREREKGSSGRTSHSQQRERSPTVEERKALLAAAATPQNKSSRPRPAVTSSMEKSQSTRELNDSTHSGRSVSSTGSSGSGSARSVISISNKNVTIISTGTDGRSTPKVTTTPLPKGPSDSDRVRPQETSVPSRRADSDFIAKLSQKFQGGGLPVPVPGSSSGHRGSSPQLSSQGGGEAAPLKPWQIAQQQQLQKRQQIPTSAAAPPPPPPAPLVNGHVDLSSSTSQVNGHSSSSMIPAPPPPPPPPPASQSAGERTTFRKADASYTPRAKTYSSVNGSMPGTPMGGGTVIDQQKTDLMSALSALVKTGSPSASLRKTSGPGKGGVNEVFSSRKVSGAMVNGSAKQVPLPTIAEFDPKNFLDQVDATDSAGNRVPDWKRHMKAKNLALKAHQVYLEQKKIDDYEARFKHMPAWKRALIEKKEAAQKA